MRGELGGAGVDAFEHSSVRHGSRARCSTHFSFSVATRQRCPDRASVKSPASLSAQSRWIQFRAGRHGRTCWFSALDDFAIRARNHGSNLVTAWISSSLSPWRMACAIRCAAGLVFAGCIALNDRGLVVGVIARGQRSGRDFNLVKVPSGRFPSKARAFCIDSWMVRPMAMASPTDFIAVVR